MAKSPCPVSKTQFLEKAEAVKISLAGNEMLCEKREFSTGSFGWYLNGKTTIDKREIPGITGGALDSREAQPGPIYLQGSEKGHVYFRKIVIIPAEPAS